MISLRLAAAAALAVLWSTASSAAVTVYSSEADFDAAAAVTRYSVDTAGAVGGFFGQKTYAQNGVSFAASAVSALYKVLPSDPAGGAYGAGNFLSFQAYDSTTSGTITGSSNSLGFTFGSYNGGGSTVTFSGTGFSQTVALPGNPTTGFFGVISDTPLGAISFTSARGIVDITTFSTAAVAAVPEPATWAMLLIGFGAVGSAVRARRRTLATLA